jgi:CheY-like chemotaxis protein
MNKPNFPRGGGRRRRRKHGGGGQPGQLGGRSGRSRGRGTAFVGPMDHSYRNNQPGGGNGLGGGSNRFRPGPMTSGTTGFFQHADVEPLPVSEDSSTRIFAFIDDLFFRTKIQETARKLNVKVEFVKTEKEVLDSIEASEGQPSLIIFDLNNAGAKPLSTIPKLKSRLKKATSIVGFVSHVQGELKVKALEVGCDAVMPRSAFSQNLPQLLRRHGASQEQVEEAHGLPEA